PQHQQLQLGSHRMLLREPDEQRVSHVREPDQLEELRQIEDHDRSPSAAAAARRGQTLIQGVVHTYLMDARCRISILMTTPHMLRNKNAVMPKRTPPQRRMKSRPLRRTTHQYISAVPTAKKPITNAPPTRKSSVGFRTPSRYGRLTAVIASTLCASHGSQNQNQFQPGPRDRKSTRLNSSHANISYA